MNVNDPSPRRVVVAGTVHLDFVVTAPRHPRIGETIIGTDIAYFPGGKGANQAVAAARAGCSAVLVGCVGDDDAAATLRTFLDDAGVDLTYLRTVAGPTGTAFVTVAGDDNAVVVIRGADAHTSPADVGRLLLTPGDVLVSQFELDSDTVEAFFSAGKAAGACTLLNPSPSRPTPPSLWYASDVVVVNEIELKWLGQTAGIADSETEIKDCAASLLARDNQAVVVTLGPGGCLVVDRMGATKITGRSVHVSDTTGAGDCFLGNMAAQLAAGHDLRAAAEVANVAASVSVQRMGAATSMPTAAETDRAAARSTSLNFSVSMGKACPPPTILAGRRSSFQPASWTVVAGTAQEPFINAKARRELMDDRVIQILVITLFVVALAGLVAQFH
jgi:ribokinase